MVSAAVAVAVLLLSTAAAVSGQTVATSCTASLISTFTPCLNFVTGSTNGGGSPTQQCCRAVAGVVRTAQDCACLILTGNVPFGLPINRTLAISLTRICKSLSVPLQCRGQSGVSGLWTELQLLLRRTLILTASELIND
jgi:hypothetical protein